MHDMSAKERAFEQERVKYRQEIRRLNGIIGKQAKAEFDQEMKLAAANDKIREQEEWIRRLLEYMDVPGETLQAKLQTEERFSRLLSAIGYAKGGYIIDEYMQPIITNMRRDKG